MSILQLVESDREAQRDKLENLLQEFSVTHVRKSAGGALSGGERRRVEIARALASDPSFILLDEPFAGIDPIAISDIRELVAQLKDRGLGVLITDHNVRETLSIIDRAVIMHDGHVLTEGTADEIVNNEACARIIWAMISPFNAPLIDCRLDSGLASGILHAGALKQACVFTSACPRRACAARVV